MASRLYFTGLFFFLLSSKSLLLGQGLEELPVPRCSVVNYFYALGKEFASLNAPLPQQSEGSLDFYMLLSKTGQVQELRLRHKAEVSAEFLQNFFLALRRAPSWYPGKNYRGDTQDAWIYFSVEWKFFGDTIRFLPAQFPPRYQAEARVDPTKK